MGEPNSAEHGEARGDHQRVVLGDEQIFQKRHAGEQPHVLKRACDASLLGDAKLGQALEQERRAVRMREQQTADGRPVEAGEAVEHGGLAGAVRPDQRGDLARPRSERKIARPRRGRRSASSGVRPSRIGAARHAGVSVRASLTMAAGMSLRARSDTEGARVETSPRGRQIMIATMAAPNTSIRY